MLRRSLCVAVAALMTVGVAADVYMHNPRGSNNRLNEKSANRANADRMFDSQNNNRGGYNVGDRGFEAFTGGDTNTGSDASFREPAFLYNTANSVVDTKLQYQMVYYEGSELSMEWTNQHGCGGNEGSDPQKLNCDIIIQYMCQTTDGLQAAGGKLKTVAAPMIPGAESLRDGANTNTPNTITDSEDTATITSNLNKGHHESEQYYYECQTRSRNKGLFTADQGLNGNTARFTRQNNNGNRRGLECPEERDYYPYWSPSPWKDIVILTDHTELNCNAAGTYAGKSQNNNDVFKCVPPAVSASVTVAAAAKAIQAITSDSCVTNGGTWTRFTHGLPAPLCKQVEWSRVNHLGNGREGQPLMYNWTLPNVADLASAGAYLYTDSAASYAKCVVRLRYNISTDDYDPLNTTSSSNNQPWQGVYSPVTNNPTVDIGTGYEGVKLNVNTAQFGRTFQDRSHTFYIRTRPASVPATTKIYNLNVRGKRGNIVQTFPSVEYDFQPSRLEINQGDLVHVQWTGSNTHNNGDPAGDGQAGDAGEGRGGTDRHNIAQLMNFNENYPMPLDKFVDNMWSRSQCFKLDGSPLTTASTPSGDITQNTPALDCSVYLTTVGQFASAAAVNAAAASTTSTIATQFDPLLDNSPASLVGGVLMKFTPAFATGQTSKSFDYMCTRNNNFSNRGQKGTIVVLA